MDEHLTRIWGEIIKIAENWLRRFRMEGGAQRHLSFGGDRNLVCSKPSLQFVKKKSCVFPFFDQGIGRRKSTKAHEQRPEKCSMATSGNQRRQSGD